MAFNPYGLSAPYPYMGRNILEKTRLRSLLHSIVAVALVLFNIVFVQQPAQAFPPGEPSSNSPPVTTPKFKEQLVRLVAPFIGSCSGGSIVGVTDGREHVFFRTGRINRTNKNECDENTIFEIASLSKVLAGLVLADMVVHHEVGLKDPVQQFLPKGVHVPNYQGCPITLVDLATHSSGLPTAPTGRVLSENYPTRRMILFLNGYKLQRKPGTQYQYSNLGVTLMGLALTTRAGKDDYGSLLRERVAVPLGMGDTTIRLNSQQLERKALGYTSGGSVQKANGLFSCGASGAVRSTANDLLRLIDAYMAPDTVPQLASALKLSKVIEAPAEGNSDMALGWYVSRRSGNYSKNGVLPGYKTFMGFSPRKHLGVVVLGASDNFPATLLGEKLLRALP